MVVKIGDEIFFAGNQHVIIVLDKDEKRGFAHLEDDKTKCIIFNEETMTEPEALKVLQELK